MVEQRVIIEMGQGNDLHGRDYTKAARRAIDVVAYASLFAAAMIGQKRPV